MTPDEAIDAVARHYISHTIRVAMDGDYSGWEDYPEIGEGDWNRVVDRAGVLTPQEPAKDAYDEAYQLLADRAAETKEAGQHG